MTSSHKVGVLLKGGLGNQLFQIAAALYASEGSPIEIFNNYTLPRKTNGLCDALYFKIPNEVIHNSKPSSRIEKKLLSMSLSRALLSRVHNRDLILSRLITLINSLFFSIKFKERTSVISGEGTGFCQIRLVAGRNLLNGYFQAHQFAFEPTVSKKLQEIRLTSYSSALDSWIKKAKNDKPVIVHLRLGDYKVEYGIGVLPGAYYQDALSQLAEKVGSKNLWVFTNEPESVEAFVEPHPFFDMKVVGDIGLNPAETLELMRFGSAYVIANSTFSWWGAFLAYDRDCIKIMPKPWFQQLPSPSGINPKNWIEIEYLSKENE